MRITRQTVVDLLSRGLDGHRGFVRSRVRVLVRMVEALDDTLGRDTFFVRDRPRFFGVLSGGGVQSSKSEKVAHVTGVSDIQ